MTRPITIVNAKIPPPAAETTVAFRTLCWVTCMIVKSPAIAIAMLSNGAFGNLNMYGSITAIPANVYAKNIMVAYSNTCFNV